MNNQLTWETFPKKPFVFFWKPHQPYGEFSQWYHSEFAENGILFHNAEQYMMYHKAMLFRDTVIAREIIESRDPKEMRALGRKVKGFDPKSWDMVKYVIVKNGNTLKFNQNPILKSILLATRDHVLVEASPFDNIWGIGLDKSDIKATNPNKWRGQNLLGFILMEVRDNLRNPIEQGNYAYQYTTSPHP